MLLLGWFRGVLAKEEAFNVPLVEKERLAFEGQLIHSLRKKSDPTWGLEVMLKESAAYFTSPKAAAAAAAVDDLDGLGVEKLKDLCRSDKLKSFCQGFSGKRLSDLRVLVRAARLRQAAAAGRAARARQRRPPAHLRD